MAKKSSSGISISTIIFLVVMYNVVFDNDDEKKVEIVDQDTVVQTSPAPKSPTIKDSLNEIGEEFKKVGKQLKEEAVVIADDLKKEFQETKNQPEEKSPEPPEKKPELVAEPETLKPSDDAQEKQTGMKKL